MKRRSFLFTTATGAALLSPFFAARARAQTAPAPRVLFWVFSNGYPSPDAFFPEGSSETVFSLSSMLQGLSAVRDDIVIVDGVSIRRSGLNPRGADHIRSVGKVLTAADILESRVDAENEGEPGGPSIDHVIATARGAATIELLVADRGRDTMREQPFAMGPRAFKVPTVDPGQAWGRLFGGFVPPQEDPAVRAAYQRRQRSRRSVLDGALADLARVRRELDAVERVKLDTHEDAIRRVERRVQADLDASPSVSAACTLPRDEFADASMPARCADHLDLLFAGFACDRVQVAGLVWGGSGYHWPYAWAGVRVNSSIHDEVHHLAGERRDDYIRAHQWDWAQFGAFVQRLKDTPEGDGTMLDHTLVVGVSHFGHHHDIERIPVVLAGSARGRLRTGRVVRTAATNDRLLTSVAHLLDVDIAGIGDDPTCGPLPGL
jgi:hypothetical protein